MGVEDQIEGLIYCDYSDANFCCKPEPDFYYAVSLYISPLRSHDVLIASQAMSKAGITDPKKCCFIDDSRGNVAAALKVGWGRCVHFCEHGLDAVEGGKLRQIGVSADGKKEEFREATVIGKLEELRVVWADLFKPEVELN